MKKKNLKTLKLNRTPISSMNKVLITGGGSDFSACCENQSYGTCDKEKQLTPGCDHN